jgi:hypothetical protein
MFKYSSAHRLCKGIHMERLPKDHTLKHIGILILLVVVIISFITPAANTFYSPFNQGSIQGSADASHASRDLILISKSGGLETPTLESGPTALNVADMNNDGNPDIISVGDHGNPYVNTQEHGIMVWLNNGDGTWDIHQNGDFGYGGIAAGDINNDGYMDVAWGIHHDYSGVPGWGDTLEGAALGDGTGYNWIPYATGLETGGEWWGMFATDLADFDCNGLLDIVSQSFGMGQGIHVYKNHGDGNWSHVWSVDGSTLFSENNLEVGDANADGYPDIFASTNTEYVYFGNGSFGFTQHQNGLPTGQYTGIDCRDINNDGCDDIVFGEDSSGIRCYTYDKSTDSWVSASNGLPTTGTYYAQFGDINGDGFVDIVGYAGPQGYVYLGDNTGNWVQSGSWTMPSPGDYSDLVVNGDIDHDGREDIVIQAESGTNQLRVYSACIEPTDLTARVTLPHGGETYRAGSIRFIKWLAAVPPSQGPGSVNIQLSLNGVSGPWQTIAQGVPNSGCYQWFVDASGSKHCRVKITVSTGSDSVSAISPSDFAITGYLADAHGPYYGLIDQPVQFTGSAEGGTSPYIFHWTFGDGTSSEEQNPVHTYTTSENYTVKLTVTDSESIVASDTTWAYIQGSSNPPNTPMISGPSKGKINVTYTFFANATDPDGDALYYWFDWGDGNNTGWLGPINSGSVMNAKHSWSNKGSFTIKVKAKDTSGLESDWGTLSVTMPLSYEPPQFRFFEWLFERFPNAFPLFRYLIGCYD